MGFIIGACSRSDYLASASLLDQWDRCNVVVLNWILTSLSQDVYLGHVFSNNAAKQGSLPVAEYDHKLNSMRREFDALTKLPDCTCESRNEVVDHDKLIKLMQFLMGLNDVYQPIRSSILTRKVLPEAKDAFVIISREESHRGIPNTSVKTDKPQVLAFNTKFNDANKRKCSGNWSNGNSSRNWSNGNNANKGNYNSLLCKNYGLKGHAIDKCFEIIGYPPGFKRNPNLKRVNNLNNNRSNNSDVRGSIVGNSDKSASPLSLSNEQMMKLMSLLNDKSTVGTANMAGANQHMTNDTKNMFNLIDVFGLNLTVGHPNETIAKITHVGNLKLNNDVILFDVLVFPSTLSDLRKGKILRTGSEFAGLYLFDEKFNVSPIGFNIEYFSCYVSKDIWHNRLGHPANQIREAFPLSKHKSVIVGQLIHLDVWGLYKVVSKEGFRDVKFYETVFSYKMSSETSSDSSDTFGVNDLNFFDNFMSNSSPETPNESPNDDEKRTPVSREGSLHQPVFDNNNESGSDENAYHPGNDVVIYQPGHDEPHTATPIDENNQSEGNVGSSNEMDVNNAFLYGDLSEDVYMLPSPGFFDKDDKRVCKLKRNSESEIEKFKTFLNQKFKIKDLGELKYFLGIEVLKTKNGLCLNQRKYCLELLHEFGLLACRPVVTPLPENIVLCHKETANDLQNVTAYQKLVGKLIYLCMTRPDISYAVNCLSQHMHSPLQSHFDLGLRLLRYLKLAPCSGINFAKSHSKFSVIAYSDSDWAKCPVTRRLVSGYCVFVNGSLVSWKIKRHATLSKSSDEAEYRAMASVTCEIM
nr:ribonuclease H-like domain-containing protein [Tanacetum cinerariifolium]